MILAALSVVNRFIFLLLSQLKGLKDHAVAAEATGALRILIATSGSIFVPWIPLHQVRGLMSCTPSQMNLLDHRPSLSL